MTHYYCYCYYDSTRSCGTKEPWKEIALNRWICGFLIPPRLKSVQDFCSVCTPNQLSYNECIACTLWEDGMARERTDCLPSYAETEKLKSLTLPFLLLQLLCIY